ncbi:MAG: tetratricopeptide repeat protein [Alphaproteobacteria bacterium]
MTQALFEVQTFDGHGWVTRHRGADVGAAGEAARRVLPDAKRQAVRIVKQTYQPAEQRLDNQVVFSLGKPRGRSIGRVAGVAAALALSAAAIVGATLVPGLATDTLVELAHVVRDEGPVRDEAPVHDEAPISHLEQAALEPAAGAVPAGFDCRREAANGLIRATNLGAERDRLYQLCGPAIQGDAAAQLELADRLAAGTGTAPDPAQAVVWLQEAARAGHTEAYLPLADLLTRVDPERANSWYHRAATGGDTAAALTLAQRYRDGDGVDADPRIALSYELMAADAGDVPAMLRVAQAFNSGEGTDPNPEAAQRWLERAASAGGTSDLAALDDQPALHWVSPADADGDASAPEATWNPPVLSGVAQLLPVPPLHLDIDQDAQEAYSAFAAASPMPMSV